MHKYFIQYENFSDEKKTEIDNINKDMTVKKQAAAYLLSIDPETERLQVKKRIYKQKYLNFKYFLYYCIPNDRFILF